MMATSLNARFERWQRRFLDQVAWFRFRCQLGRGATSQEQIILLQSSDEEYKPILEVTAGVNRRYAEQMNYAYSQFIGNISPLPRTANFNRYYLLREVAARTRHQWALWMDADAIVVDPTVAVEPIISANPDKLLIACRGRNEGEYDINNGVFFFNLRHRESTDFLRYLIMAARDVHSHNSRFRSDQRYVQAWLKRRLRPDGRIPCLKRYAESEFDKFNYDGPFIQHVLRTRGALHQRLQLLQLARCVSDQKLTAAKETPPPAN